VRDDHAPAGQFVLELMQGQVRRLVDPLADEGTVGIQHRLAMTADLAWRHRVRRRFVC